MNNKNWEPSEPFDAVVFDCDGTLTQIEGIDELARINSVGEQVESLTKSAMVETGLRAELYEERLELVKPTEQQVIDLSHTYFENVSQDCIAVLNVLRELNKPIYVISAGVNPAVKLFAEKLAVPTDHVYAVNLEFSTEGDYLSFESDSPLIHNDGKCVILEKLKQKHPRILHIGDGLNDLSAQGCVERFVGYGGVFYSDRMDAVSHFYLRKPSLLSLLPLVLSKKEVDSLSSEASEYYQKGLSSLQEAFS